MDSNVYVVVWRRYFLGILSIENEILCALYVKILLTFLMQRKCARDLFNTEPSIRVFSSVAMFGGKLHVVKKSYVNFILC